MLRLKNRTLEWVTLLTVLIIALVLGSLNDTLSRVDIKRNNFDLAKQYLDSHTFNDISMMQFYRHVFVYNNLSKIQDFQIGLNNDNRVRVMIMNVIETSNAELKSYSIQYNRDTNYFNVIENGGGINETSQSTIEVLTKFDKYKNQIRIPKGNYSYYTVNYLWGGIGPEDNLYVINDQGVHMTKDKILDGLIFMVYGEPIKKEDSPSYYIMPY